MAKQYPAPVAKQAAGTRNSFRFSTDLSERCASGMNSALLWLRLRRAAFRCGHSLVAADKSGVSPNTISLPKGPGSIEGLGESFQPTLNTGTAKYGVRFAVRNRLSVGGAGFLLESDEDESDATDRPFDVQQASGIQPPASNHLQRR